MNFHILLVITILFVTIGAKDYYVFQARKMNWFSAFSDCLSRGLQLATVNSAEEQREMAAAIKKVLINNDHWFWVGGADLGQEGSFVWMPTGEAVTYTLWTSPQPDNNNKIEHCINVWPAWNFSWNDMDCMSNLNHVCEDRPACLDKRIV